MTRKLLTTLSLALAIVLLTTAGASARATPHRAAEVAPATVCPGQDDPELTAAEQSEVMLCLTNYARHANGLRNLVTSRQLGAAAKKKSDDIVTCDEFAHEACHRPFTFWDQRFGYLRGCWKAGENIAWGMGGLSTVGAIFTSWLESPEHRANILGAYREIGIALRLGDLDGNEGVAVWTQDFGSHQC